VLAIRIAPRATISLRDLRLPLRRRAARDLREDLETPALPAPTGIVTDIDTTGVEVQPSAQPLARVSPRAWHFPQLRVWLIRFCFVLWVLGCRSWVSTSDALSLKGADVPIEWNLVLRQNLCLRLPDQVGFDYQLSVCVE